MNFSDLESNRTRLGVTQRALCERAGVHYMTYSSIKNGRQIPNVRTLQKLEQALIAIEQERLERADA
ncbi:helix-turn-helix domain-containing protein [Ochrobactrum sp. 19YEA23]|uniref:helix-turn-helix domain-containing protein n=1 Tax=Ochrobactrum sp. 19YEA23 TaxID=3039854 RepID=UPI00370981B1